MIINSRWKRSSAVMVTMGLVIGCMLSGLNVLPWGSGRVAHAQGADSGQAVTWEYKTTSIDAASLQTHLTSLGADGWEAFSITTTDASVDTGPDGKPHLTTQRFEVSAKRKSKH